MGNGRKRKVERIQEQKKDESEFNLPAKFLKSSHVRAQEKRLIIVLEGAHLETVKVIFQFINNMQRKLHNNIFIETLRLATRLNY